MAEDDTEDLDILDDGDLDDEADDAESDAVGGGNDAADEDADDDAQSAESPNKSEKRIRDLQSKYDKAQAELNRLKSQQAKGGGTEDTKSRDPEVQRWMDVAKDATRARIYEADPRLRAYKIDPSVIAGDTPDQMNASAKLISSIVRKVETSVRNSVMQEHGFSAPPRESGTDSRRDYGTMKQDDFDRLVRESVGG